MLSQCIRQDRVEAMCMRLFFLGHFRVDSSLGKGTLQSSPRLRDTGPGLFLAAGESLSNLNDKPILGVLQR